LVVGLVVGGCWGARGSPVAQLFRCPFLLVKAGKMP